MSETMARSATSRLDAAPDTQQESERRSAEAPAPVLTVAGLTKRFGGLTAVNDLTFRVGRGEVLAIVGPNGAGKSTLFQLISGVEKPDAGSIRLGSVELVGRPPEQITGLGVARTFQTPRVFPGLSVWDSVRVGLHVRLIGGHPSGRRVNPLQELYWGLVRPPAFRAREREVEQAVEQALQRFGERLWPRRLHRADSLSYANRRRLEIARAIAQQPTVLLLDEPTAGMNPTETSEFATFLQELHADWPSMTVILVEHKLNFVRTVAQRVLVMNQGQKLVEGRPDVVMRDRRVVEAYLGTRTEAPQTRAAAVEQDATGPAAASAWDTEKGMSAR